MDKQAIFWGKCKDTVINPADETPVGGLILRERTDAISAVEPAHEICFLWRDVPLSWRTGMLDDVVRRSIMNIDRIAPETKHIL